MQKIIGIVTFALIVVVATTILAQDKKPEPKNYVEIRGSRIYQYGEYTRTLNDKIIVDLSFIRTGGLDQGFVGVGRTFKLGNVGTLNALLYGVVGSHDQLGVMPALLVPSLQRGRLKTTAFVGLFIPAKGEVHQYLVLDTWDTTAEVTKKLDLGSSVGFFLQDGKWNPLYGPMLRLNDKRGAWLASYRVGTGRELRFSRTFEF